VVGAAKDDTGGISLIRVEKVPKVSVCVVTYNQEKYIRQCLQSVVDQETNFDFEVIVGEDCSTDGTRVIVQEFAEKYPSVMKPIFHEVNVGGMQNYYDVHKAARGEYIAHIDGDDYALPGKLQVQADTLDKNQHLSIIWHRMELINEKGIRKPHPCASAPFINKNISREDLFLYGPFGPHSSTMYRRDNLVVQENDADIIDWQLSIEIIGNGSGIMLQEVLGGYRVHARGVSTGATANVNTRTLLCDCQIHLMERFPEYKSTIALRAIFVALLDSIRLKSYCSKSLGVLISSRRLPKITKAFKLIQFYRYSKLPSEFKLPIDSDC
jgi:glycosyltransferase involved in cell wall biosynthesis